MPIYVKGAKIGNNCKGFIISIFKRITEESGGDEEYKNNYVSFLLYSTDSEQKYTGDDPNSTITHHKIFDHPIESFTINGLNISNGTDISRVSYTSTEYATMVGLDKNITNLNIDDLDNIFINNYMLGITGRSTTEPYKFIALSCNPLITDKSVGVFRMKCDKYRQISGSGERMKTEVIAAEFD
jgi:hypothetical protein